MYFKCHNYRCNQVEINTITSTLPNSYQAVSYVIIKITESHSYFLQLGLYESFSNAFPSFVSMRKVVVVCQEFDNLWKVEIIVDENN